MPLKAEQIVSTAKALAHPKGTAKKKWAYKTGAPLTAYKTALKKVCKKTAKVSQSDCGYFVNTVVRTAEVDPKFRALAGTDRPFPKSKKFKIIYKGKKGKKVPKSILKPGHIIRYKTKTGQHTLIYMGDGCIAEAGREKRFPIIRKSSKYNGTSVKRDTLQVLEVIE